MKPGRAPVRAIGRFLLVILVAGLVVGGAAFQYLRPVPAVAARPLVPTASAADTVAPTLPWPAKGGAAVGTADTGVLATGGSTTPMPMFSVAKLMTVLVLLEDKPLKPGEQGPTITVDPSDVQSYARRLAAGESVVKVAAGEQLSEYQAIQALLIPSGNNIGELLAKWDAGSEAQMVVRLNARAKALHLAGTSFEDVTGVSAATRSLPAELVTLGAMAMKDPVISAIVGQKQAELPVAGVVYNVDYVLGQDGIIGIKTGSSPEGGANFVFASTNQVEGREIDILGAVMGQDTLDDAFNASKALIEAARPNIGIKHVLGKNQVVGRYATPWGSTASIVAQQDLDVVTWPGQAVRTQFLARPVNGPAAAGLVVGSFSVSAGDQALSAPLAIDAPISKPPLKYRLTRTDF